MPLAAGQTAEAAEIRVRGVPVQYGGLTVTLFGRSFSFKPTPVGEGGVGLLFELEERRLLNLGDPLLLEETWRGLRPDVLMVPIGGMMTMGVDDALRAVAAIEPAVGIPVHYNWDIIFYHRPAEVKSFATAVRVEGRQCLPLRPGEDTEV